MISFEIAVVFNREKQEEGFALLVDGEIVNYATVLSPSSFTESIKQYLKKAFKIAKYDLLNKIFLQPGSLFDESNLIVTKASLQSKNVE